MADDKRNVTFNIGERTGVNTNVAGDMDRQLLRALAALEGRAQPTRSAFGRTTQNSLPLGSANTTHDSLPFWPTSTPARDGRHVPRRAALDLMPWAGGTRTVDWSARRSGQSRCFHRATRVRGDTVFPWFRETTTVARSCGQVARSVGRGRRGGRSHRGAVARRPALVNQCHVDHLHARGCCHFGLLGLGFRHPASVCRHR